MLIRDELSDLFDYNTWANERMISSIESLDAAEYRRGLGGGWPSVADTVAHLRVGVIAAAERPEQRPRWSEPTHGLGIEAGDVEPPRSVDP